MADSDGTIRVDTSVDDKGFDRAIKSMSAKSARLANSIRNTEQELKKLNAEARELAMKKVPTKEYEILQKELSNTVEKQNRLKESLAEFDGVTDKQNLPLFQELSEKLEDSYSKTDRLIAKMKELAESGKSFTLGKDSAEYQSKVDKIGQLNNKLTIQKKQWDENNAKQNKYFKNVSQASGKATKKLGTFNSRLKGIALSLLVFNWITKAFNAMIDAVKEGNQNLAKYSDTYNTSLSSLKSANTQMKNSWATAFAPIAQMVIPHLIQLISYVTTAANALARFTALMSGKNTWTKAKAVQEDYAASLEGSADAAKDAEKAMEGYLSPLDEINKYKINDSSSSSEKSGSGVSAKDMFEEVAIDDATLAKYDVLKKRVEEIRDLFNEGFEEGLVSDKTDEVKKNLLDIKKKMIGIYNNPELANARKEYEDSFAKLAGTVAGSIASISTSIGYGVTEATKHTLDDAEPYIVKKGASIYDNMTRANTSMSDFSKAAAEIGTAFESKGFIKIVEFFEEMGTWVSLDILDSATGLLSDMVDLWSKPVLKNATEWKELLENIFTIIANGLGPAEKGLDVILGKGLKYEDSLIHKLLQDFSDWNADSIGAGLGVVNDELQKFIDWQEKMKSFSLADWWAENRRARDEEKLDFSEFVKDQKQKNKEWADNISSNLEEIKTKAAEKWDGFKMVSSEKWNEFREWWKNNTLSKWWTEDIEPWFKKEKWIETMKGMKEGAIETFNATVDSVKAKWNEFADWINEHLTIRIDTNSIIGKGLSTILGSNTIKLANFPHLATGTVVPAGVSEFLAVLGDNKRETEVVSPMSTIEKAVENVLARNGSVNGSVTINFLLPNKQIVAQYAIEGGQVIQTITGNNPFELA